jgi:two-component system, chemotaxis family, protein-glutamate methylesterase/glutaminase
VSPGGLPRVTRVLLVDGGAAPDGHLAGLVAGAPGLVLVGRVRTGEEGLREVARSEPDVVLLDLQALRLEGFTFLRLMGRRSTTPVVVVAPAARRGDVFRALELGALDFVERPEAPGSPEAFRQELLETCAGACAARSALRDGPPGHQGPPHPARAGGRTRRRTVGAAVAGGRVAALGASTGGPQALQQLLAELPREVPLAVLVAQHMPVRFTAPFAERLQRTTSLEAKEAADGDLALPGRILVAPGGHHMELARDRAGQAWVRVLPAEAQPTRCTPSVDRLFASVAAVAGPLACGVVLTGMGDDGTAGVQAIRRSGGLTLAESADTAVVYGMPLAAVEGGAVDEVLALEAIAGRLIRFAGEG